MANLFARVIQAINAPGRWLELFMTARPAPEPGRCSECGWYAADPKDTECRDCWLNRQW